MTEKNRSMRRFEGKYEKNKKKQEVLLELFQDLVAYLKNNHYICAVVLIFASEKCILRRHYIMKKLH